jgi:hypothetical protein
MIYVMIELPIFRYLAVYETMDEAVSKLSELNLRVKSLTFYKPTELCRCLEDYPHVPANDLTYIWNGLSAQHKENKEGDYDLRDS